MEAYQIISRLRETLGKCNLQIKYFEHYFREKGDNKRADDQAEFYRCVKIVLDETNNTRAGDKYWVMGTGVYIAPPIGASSMDATLICTCETVEQAHTLRRHMIDVSK